MAVVSAIIDPRVLTMPGGGRGEEGRWGVGGGGTHLLLAFVV